MKSEPLFVSVTVKSTCISGACNTINPVSNSLPKFADNGMIHCNFQTFAPDATPAANSVPVGVQLPPPSGADTLIQQIHTVSCSINQIHITEIQINTKTAYN